MHCPTLKKLPPPPSGRTGWPWTDEAMQMPDTMPNGLPWPRISIVTPSYNQGQFLEETIRSVLLQGYPNLGYIIIDGESTDDSVKIIKKYESWLSYWVSEPDKGQTYAIDKGMRRAEGIILNWLNSDDFLFPGALNALAIVYLENEKKDCIFAGNARYVNEYGKTIKESLVQSIDPKDTICPMFPPLSGGIQASWFFSSEAWKRVNGINLNLNYRMDTDLYIRFKEAGFSFVPVNYTLAAYRSHSNTKTRRGWRENAHYKKQFYLQQLTKLDLEEQKYYMKRVKRMLFGFYLQGVSSHDSLYSRFLKVILAIREYPRALRSLYQIKRSLLLLAFPPDDIEVE